MTAFRRTTLFTLALILGLHATASAQFARGIRANQSPQPASLDEPEGWGLNSPNTVTFSTLDFIPIFGSANPLNGANGFASCSTGDCFWVATLRVPTGVSIRALELSACDGDTTKSIEANLAAGPKVPGNPADITPFIETGVVPAPGCVALNFVLPTPVTIDNNSFWYAIQVGAQAGTNMTWSQVRVRYRLQVSPAPGTATFADVPLGHPQRQFIEALNASGITGGCGGGNYCPDTPVTRGQMAVFLAAALGMHWSF